MSKDHIPSDFARKSGYKSDLEVAETGPMVKSVNTSFGSRNHNAYIHRSDGTHEHFYYSPKDAKSGWHGHNWETRNNHPQVQTKSKTNPEGGKTMDKNSFIESIKVDKATVDRCNEVSRNAAKNATTQSGGKSGADHGGRERGDSGPASLGREPGNKDGSFSTRSISSEGHGSSGQGSSGHGEGGHGSTGGHGTGGQSGSGQGSGGHGGH